MAAKPNRAVVSALSVALVLAGLGLWGFCQWREARAAKVLSYLAAEAAAVVRAEDHSPGEAASKLAGSLRLYRSEDSPAGELARGIEAFWGGDLKNSALTFSNLADRFPDIPDLLSFSATANLRLGNAALAVDSYSQVLVKKEAFGASGLELSSDRLGLALGLFLLHRPQTAEEPARLAFESRLKSLGAGAIDTVSAANKLAVIYIARQKNGEAEELLKDVYPKALKNAESVAALLEETNLLLTLLYAQDNRLDELSDFYAKAAMASSFTLDSGPDEADSGEAEAPALPAEGQTLNQQAESKNPAAGPDGEDKPRTAAGLAPPEQTSKPEELNSALQELKTAGQRQSLPDAPEGRPTLESLRRELASLSAQNRRAEFGKKLEPVLAETAEIYGKNSFEYMRYFALKLRWLEEEKRYIDLTAELMLQSQNPPGRGEAEKALNKASALAYAARINEKAGRAGQAAILYEKALEALDGYTEDALEARRQSIDESLKRLRKE